MQVNPNDPSHTDLHKLIKKHYRQVIKDKLVAYSCKGRTICPRCNGRKRADTVKHLVEEVIPEVPVRQWVLSMPFKHRFVLSSDQKLLNTVLKIFNRMISTHYKKKAKSKGFVLPQIGSVTAIQRFGGSENLNIHFHTLFMDGVFVTNSEGKQRFVELIPTDEKKKLTLTIHSRVKRAFE
jgi:hypothetical protein